MLRRLFLQRSPRNGAIVDAAWLRGRLEHAGPKPIVVHTGWAGRGVHDYRAGHIPGAIHLDTDAYEDGYPTWRLLEDARLQGVLGAHGIDPGASVVVYGAQSIAAARTWWVLLYAGVRDVKYLDGGLAAWQTAGGVIERTALRPSPVDFRATPRRELCIETAELHTAPGQQLADVRSSAEFDGTTSGYDYLRFAGRIPGAIALGDADDSARIYQRPDGRLHCARKIAARWRAAGLDPARELVLYCGNGWRSSLAFLYAWELGYRMPRNYSDGWAGWSTHFMCEEAA